MSPLANLSALFILLFIASTSYARLAPDNYWHIMKNEAMPDTVQDLIDMRNSVSPLFNKKTDCEATISSSLPKDKLVKYNVHKKPVVDESEPIPDITIYNYNFGSKGKKSTIDNSEPVPDVTIYHDGSDLKEKKATIDDSEPVPDVTIYHYDSDLKEKKATIDDSEPVPDITICHDDSGLEVKKSTVAEVEPVSDATIYHG